MAVGGYAQPIKMNEKQ